MLPSPRTGGPRHYDTRRWRRLSAAKLAADPVCQVCHEEPSAHVHHIIPLDRRGKDTWENLQSVCIHCHNAIQPGADRDAGPGGPPPGRAV
jgi:5-methylcytosine-specific restriction endonuclease McrA